MINQLVRYLDGTSGICNASGLSASYSGTALISTSSDGSEVNLICNFVPNSDDTITSVSFAFDTCLGQLTHSTSLNRPVIADMTHALIVTIRIARV